MIKQLLSMVLMLVLCLPAFASDLDDNLTSKYATGRSQQDEYNRLVDAKNDIIALEEDDVQLYPGDFFVDFGSTIQRVSASTAPGIESDNKIIAIVWADGEQTAAQATFRVPNTNNDSGTGKFHVLIDSSASASTVKLDYSVYVNGDNTAWDAAVTDQTPVAATTESGTPCMLTLTPATDFASLAPGDIVTINIWRDDVADGTGDLEVYYVGFSMDE